MTTGGFFSPPPEAQPSSRRTTSAAKTRHHPSERVDMDTLVWPPPDPTSQISQQSTSARTNSRLQPPQQSSSSAARYRPQSTPISAHHSRPYPTESNIQQRRAQKASENASGHPHISHPSTAHRRAHTTHTQYPTQGYAQSQTYGSQQPTTSPLRPSFLHANTSPPTMGGLGNDRTSSYGLKDYPSGYSPTPVPAPPIPSQYNYAYPIQPQTQPPQELGFFEPLSDAFSPPTPSLSPNLQTDGYLSPVMEHGRQLGMCRIPNHLVPGGVVERGWPEEYMQARSRTHSYTHSHGHTPQPPSQSILASPLRYSSNPLDSSPSSSSSEDNDERRDTDTPPIPTRLGYWNRRGDTIGPNGHIRPAPENLKYPPDLRGYPKYALMNELGELTLPATDVERVWSWREYQD